MSRPHSFARLVRAFYARVASQALLAMLVLLAACVGKDGDSAWEEELPQEDTGVTAARAKAIGTPTWPISGVSASTCYHTPGSAYHAPSGGVSNADDTYALDINCSGGSESGKWAVPARAGTVRQVSTSSGWVLVEHPESVTVDGVSWSKFYTGYVHLTSIPASITAGAAVTTSTQLGKVSNVGCSGCGVHLHFIAYVGTASSGNNGKLISFDPSTLGGDFSSFGYGSYVWRRFVDDNTGSATYAFVSNGTSSDLYSSSSYGIRGTTQYTTTKTGSSDNSYEFKFNVTIPSSGKYYAWPFVPSNYATARYASYVLRSGTSTSTSSQSAVSTGWSTVNQYSISDDYAKLAKVSLSSGRYTTVTVGDGTGESGRYLGGDQVSLWRKMDHCVGNCSYAPTSEQNYCLVTDYTSTSSGCTTTSTVSSSY